MAPAIQPQGAAAEGEDLRVMRRLTLTLCWGGLGFSLVGVTVTSFFTHQAGRALVTALAGLVCTGGLWLVRRGRVRTAARGTLWLMWLVMALGATFNGGVEAPGLVASVMLASFAALVFGLAEALILCGCTALLCVVLMVWPPVPGPPAPPELRALIYVLISTVTAVLLWQTAALLRSAAAAAREEAARRGEIEAALRETEERNRAILESALDAILTADGAGRLTGWCRQAEVIFGWSEAEILGRELGEVLLAPAARVRMATIRRGLLAAADVAPRERRLELVAVRRDGTEFPSEWSLAATRVGGATFFSAFVRDISESRRAADEALRRHRFNEAILNTADGLIVVLDRAGGIIRFNPACERLTGWSSAEVLGRCFFDFLIPPEQVEGVRRTFTSLQAGNFPNRYENDWLARDGSRRWIAWANSALLDNRGEIELILGTGVDISATRLMTEALRLSEERYQLAIRGSSAGVWDWNVLTNEVFYSPRFKEMLGYTADEFPHHVESFLAVLHPDDRAAEAAAVAANHSEHNAPYDLEYRLRTKAGDYRWFHTRGEVLRDEAGRPHRMAGSIVDITARKAAEHDLHRLNAELEARVRDRTGELNAHVTTVEQLNRELEAFSYSVSHDLRAPLRNITGFLELLAKRVSDRLDAESARFVSVVITEAGRMGMLIDDLLTFSHIGRTEMVLQPVQPGKLIDETLEELRTEIGERQITWKIGALPEVRADRVLLRQVFANLLGNAVKFTRHRTPATIEVDVLTGPDEAGMVTLFVRDNGAGFNPKYQDKLFGVFQRLHNARDFEGTGIGLANVQRIVARHGGRIWAEGNIDKGAVFYFTLGTQPAR